MDGFASAFPLDRTDVSAIGDGLSGCILYIDDFDAEPLSEAQTAPDILDPSPPLLTQHDLDVARQKGRDEGALAALDDARLMQSQLAAASLQSLADALDAARASLERLARQSAESGMRVVLAVLQAALPAAMSRHAQGELDAIFTALLPAMTCEAEMRVRAYPGAADGIRETLIRLLPQDGIVLSVVADPQLASGDVHIAWQNGGAQRDCAVIWNEIRAALAPLDLPELEELCHAYRN